MFCYQADKLPFVCPACSKAFVSLTFLCEQQIYSRQPVPDKV